MRTLTARPYRDEWLFEWFCSLHIEEVTTYQYIVFSNGCSFFVRDDHWANAIPGRRCINVSIESSEWWFSPDFCVHFFDNWLFHMIPHINRNGKRRPSKFITIWTDFIITIRSRSRVKKRCVLWLKHILRPNACHVDTSTTAWIANKCGGRYKFIYNSVFFFLSRLLWFLLMLLLVSLTNSHRSMNGIHSLT